MVNATLGSLSYDVSRNLERGDTIDRELREMHRSIHGLERRIQTLERATSHSIVPDVLDSGVAVSVREALENTAYYLHSAGIYEHHITKLFDRIGRSGIVPDVDDQREIVTDLTRELSSLSERHRKAVYNLLGRLIVEALGPDYKKVTDAIQDGLVSPQEYEGLVKLLDVAVERIKRARQILSEGYVLIGDMGHDRLVGSESRRVLGLGDTTHLLIEAYNRGNADEIRVRRDTNRDIYGGIRPAKDRVMFGEEGIDPRTVRVDRVAIFPNGSYKHALTELDRLEEAINGSMEAEVLYDRRMTGSHRQILRDLASRYDEISVRRDAVLHDLTTALGYVDRRHELSGSTVEEFSGYVMAVERILAGNPWISNAANSNGIGTQLKIHNIVKDSVNRIVREREARQRVLAEFGRYSAEVGNYNGSWTTRDKALTAKSKAQALVGNNPWLRQTAGYATFQQSCRKVDSDSHISGR